MAYNSSNNINSLKTVCGIGLVGLETSFKGPAPGPSPDKPDIVEEAINFYRVNIIMRNFPVRGPADRTLIYLFVYMNRVLNEFAKLNTLTEAEQKANLLAQELVLDANKYDTDFLLYGSLEQCPLV